MILSEFSKFLQEHNDEIIKNKTTLSLLTAWILSVLEKPAQTNVEKVIHQEIDFYQNKAGDFFLVAKSRSDTSLPRRRSRVEPPTKNSSSSRRDER